MLCFIPIMIIIRAIIFLINKRKRSTINWHHEFGLLIFGLYCVGVASQTFIPKLEFGRNSFIVNQNLHGEINLIPGKFIFDLINECIRNGNSDYFIINIIGNVCIFIVIGFGLSTLWNITFKKNIIIGILSSLFIEIIQLPQARGSDIDDILINVMGIIIGYELYKLISSKGCIDKIISKYR